MGISLSILLIAVGAVLAWAVNAEVAGIDLQVAGIILVVVGVSDSSHRSSSGRAGAALVAVTEARTRLSSSGIATRTSAR